MIPDSCLPAPLQYKRTEISSPGHLHAISRHTSARASPYTHARSRGSPRRISPDTPASAPARKEGTGGGLSACDSGRAAPSAPGPPGRIWEQPPRSPVPVVDVGGVRPLLHDPARVSLSPLGHRDRDCRLRSEHPWKLLEPPRRLPLSARRGPFRHAPAVQPRLIGSVRLIGSAAPPPPPWAAP